MSFLRKLPAMLLSLLVWPAFVQNGRGQDGLGLEGPGQQPIQPLRTEVRSGGTVEFATIFHEIDDPTSGARWLLVHATDHPGAPGNLILISSDRSPQAAAIFHQNPRLPPPVIRAGDVLILEEHTRVVDARLEAIALGPACIGAVLRARLKLGGRVVRAVASGPGSAILAPETEQQP